MPCKLFYVTRVSGTIVEVMAKTKEEALSYIHDGVESAEQLALFYYN